ncbi:MAG: carbohydrate kinase [Clostridiales bacterium]|nr:carbohydrate kinase [Clostridiales bacterium]
MAIGGLDIGSTGCKVTVYDDTGKYVYRAYRDYPILRSTGEHEVQAEAIWQGVCEVLQDAAVHAPELTALGVTSFGESCVLLDEQDRPIRPIMLYTDPRGSGACRELTEKLGRERIEQIAGVAPHSMYSLPKVMWVKKHCPEEYEKTRRVLMMEDFVIYMLTGNAVIDYSLAARSMGFDIQSLEWSQEIFQAAEVDSSLFSRPVPGGTCAGQIKPEMAKLLGLSPELLLVPTGHDQVAAAIGSGVFRADRAVDGAGTVECITPVFEGIPDDRRIYDGGYAIVPYVIPGSYVTYAFSFTGGALVSWFIRHLAKAEKGLAKEQGRTVYEVLEEGMKDEPTGILVLPHFAGAATPYMDEGARGAVVGLTIEHSTSDLYRAMMEGVVYEMMLNMEHLKAAGICPKKLRATGGGASSGVWMQMKADMLNLPIVSLGNAEAGAAGCAMMAGVASGLFRDLREAAEALITEKHTYLPRPEMHEAYQKHYERYRRLYDAVRPLV